MKRRRAGGAAVLGAGMVAALVAGPVQAAGGTVAWGTTASAPAGVLAQLFGVAAVPGQAWAVGGFNPGVAPTAVLTAPYAEHWNGTSWAATPVPLQQVYPAGSQGAQLQGAAAVSVSDVWAVGWVEDRSSLASTTLAYHWNGSTWTRATTPNPGGATLPNRLNAVVARSAGVVFAVGDRGFPSASMVQRYDGTSWSSLTVPNIGSLTSAAVDTTNLWVAGISAVQQFDGNRWTRLPAPPAANGYLQLHGLAKSSTGLWAVGTDLIPYFEGYLARPYAAFWNGATWTRATVGAPTGFSAVTASGSSVWATAGATVTRLRVTGSTQEVTPILPAGLLTAVTSDGAQHPWAVGWNSTAPAIINAPGINQGGISVTTGYSGATITWIGPTTGSGSADTSGDYAVGGLPSGTYTVIAAAGGCAPGVATATIAAGAVTVVSAQVTC